MRFFHLSDLHIGLRLLNQDLQEDQEYILGEITNFAAQEQPDAVVIAGDIYDRAVPSAEAVEVFDRFLTGLCAAVPHAAVMLISGNHDSGPRVNCFRSLLQKQNVYMVGMPPQGPEEHIARVTLCDADGPVHFWLLPFVKPSMVKQIVGTDENGNNLSYDESLRRLLEREKIPEAERNVLVSHQFYVPAGQDAALIERAESEIITVGNIDAVRSDVLAPFDYAALGHIHKPMRVGSDRYRFCGTPMAYSVSEAGQAKGIIEVDMGEKGQVHTKVIPLIPLHAVRVIRGLREDVLAQACGDYVSVILTDPVDFDALDLRDELSRAFPRLLEIRREYVRQADYGTEGMPEEGEKKDPYDLILSFLGETDEEERTILADVVNTILARGEGRSS